MAVPFVVRLRLDEDADIDVASLSDNGLSNREAVYYYMGNTFSAMRVGPFKFHRYIAKATSRDGIPGFLNGSTLEKTFGLYAFNLYLDPKVRRPNGIRTAIQLKRFVSLETRHLNTFKEEISSAE